MATPVLLRATLILLLIAALNALVGCDDPGPAELDGDELSTEPNTRYVPADEEVSIARDRILDFQVRDAAIPDYSVIWRRPGSPDAIGPRYRYFPAAFGIDTLTALISYPDRTLEHRWLVRVTYPAANVEFLPAETELATVADAAYPLRASSDHPALSEYRWTRDGAEVGTDSVYVYDDPGAGTAVVRCEVTVGEAVHECEWTIETKPIEDISIPLVPDVTAVPGSEYAELRVRWSPIDFWFLPIEEYEVLLSTEGAITAENRADALVAAVVPESGGVSYIHALYAPDDDRLDPDATVWFAVSARDASGRASAPGPEVSYHVPNYWYIEGRVTGPLGAPLENVGVSDPVHRFSARTDADGLYRIGPFSETHTVTLVASASDSGLEGEWYDVKSEPQTLDGDRSCDLPLIPRYGIDDRCDLPAYGQDFLLYMKSMTRTYREFEYRTNYKLYRWPSYPLKIYVPEYEAEIGPDMEFATREAIWVWNLLLGDPIFVETDDAADADIEMIFDAEASNAFGKCIFVAPEAAVGHPEAAIPERAEVFLFGELIPNPVHARMTAAHELGHALGMYNHASCSGSNYLMYYNNSVPEEYWPDRAIHEDELNLVRTLRYLPQGQDMSLFIVP